MHNKKNITKKNHFKLITKISMNKRANLYLAALLGATTPLLATPALSAQNYSQATMQQQNSCKGNVKDSNG